MPRRKLEADPTVSTRVLRLRLKEKHARYLRESAFHVNQVFNYANELGLKVWQREHRFIGSDEIDRYTKGATKAGLPLHSQTVQAVTQEYVARRASRRRNASFPTPLGPATIRWCSDTDLNIGLFIANSNRKAG
jgi:hypothetical protein